MNNSTKIKTKILILIAAFIIINIFTEFIHAKETNQNFPAIFELSNLTGKNGFTINGIYEKDESGWSVSKAGDINGDGIQDMLIGALGANDNKGQAYILFGSKQNWSERIYLENLNGTNGVIINGIQGADDYAPFFLSAAGDINRDDIDDILIGVLSIGKAYVIFGSKKQWPRTIDLTNFGNINGFIVNNMVPGNRNADDYIDNYISGAGDVNGDHIDDIIIGNGLANNSTGKTYIIFGSKDPWPAIFNVTDLNGNNGFTIEGINKSDLSGQCISGIGDVNGDKINDIFIFAPYADSSKGQGYVVFGSNSTWPAKVPLSSLNGTNGFIIAGEFPKSDSTANLVSASGAGDINADGLMDILIGVPAANDYVGICYVIFGRKEKWPTIFELNNLDGSNGLTINGKNDRRAWLGISVSGTRDINNDGVDDIFIGTVTDTNFNSQGENYVIFGSKKQWLPALYVQDLSGSNGFIINNIPNNIDDYNYVTGPGDINGDGINDLLIGDMRVKGQTGQTYLIFGCCASTPNNENIPFILEMALGLGGGILVLTGIGSYYGYQYCRQGDYTSIQ